MIDKEIKEEVSTNRTTNVIDPSTGRDVGPNSPFDPQPNPPSIKMEDRMAK